MTSRRDGFAATITIALFVVSVPGLAPEPLAANHLGPGRAYLVADLVPEIDGPPPIELFPLRDVVLFFHVDDRDPLDIRIDLLRSDGTEGGTYSLIPPGYHWSRGIQIGHDLYYFALCSEELTGSECPAERTSVWRTDGSRGGTFPIVEDGGLPNECCRFGVTGAPILDSDTFVLLAGTVLGGEFVYQIWTTDGTVEGTRFVETFPWFAAGAPGAAPGHVYFFLSLDQPTPFRGFTRQLWRTDGTPGGTEAVTDPDLDVVDHWIAEDGLWFLARETPESDLSLWVLAFGEPAPKRLAGLDLDDIALETLVQADSRGRLYLVVRGEERRRLWVSDGSAAGTRQVLPSGQHPDIPEDALFVPSLPAGDLLTLVVESSSLGRELWLTDGTPGGTGPVADLCPGECSSHPRVHTTNGERVWFGVTPGDGAGRQLWSWAPGEEPRLRLALCEAPCAVGIQLAMTLPGRLLVAADSESGDGGMWAVELASDAVTPIDGVPPGARFRTGTAFLASWAAAGDRVFFAMNDLEHGRELWAVPLPGAGASGDPPPPPTEPVTSPELPGYAVWVRIQGGGAEIVGRAEPDCIPETLCVSGAVPGRSELFVRIVGPKPNGFLWPTLVKFTTSRVEVWIEQLSTGQIRYYELEGASPVSSDLPGLFDRLGFRPL